MQVEHYKPLIKQVIEHVLQGEKVPVSEKIPAYFMSSSDLASGSRPD